MFVAEAVIVHSAAAVAAAVVAAGSNFGRVVDSLETWLHPAYTLAALVVPGCYSQMEASYWQKVVVKGFQIPYSHGLQH